MTKISFEEIAESLARLGQDKARDRIALFRKEKLLSDLQYIALLHLVNGGDPKLTRNLEKQARFTNKDRAISEVIVAVIVVITTLLVIYSCGGVQ